MTLFMAVSIFLLSGAIAAWSFLLIVRRYRSPSGFPWIPALLFAASAVAAILALNVLAGS